MSCADDLRTCEKDGLDETSETCEVMRSRRQTRWKNVCGLYPEAGQDRVFVMMW